MAGHIVSSNGDKHTKVARHKSTLHSAVLVQGRDSLCCDVQVKEILAYAAQRFIEVVPEIELPGHCGAALASYPYLGCRGDCSPVTLNTLLPLFRARHLMFDTI